MRVPDGWKLSTIGSMADTVMGYAFKSNDFVDHGIPLIRMGNLYQNQLQLGRSPVFLPEHFASEYQRFIINHGDLVMSMTGTMGKRDYGFTVQIPAEAPVCLLNQRVMKILPKKLTSREYLLNLLRSEHILSKLYSFPGGTKQANLSSQQVLELPTLIPPFFEQQKIAQILSTWDKAIEKLEALIAAKQAHKKALMQQLLTGKKRFAEFDGEWKEVRLSDLLKGKKCKGKIVSTNAEFNGLPYIGSTSFEGSFGLYSDSDEAVTCISTDILILWDGENAGKVATNLTGVVSSTVVRCRLNNDKANNEFIAYCLLKDNYKIRAIREGSGIPHMPGDFEHWYELKLPPIKEQQKIASVLSVADKEIETHKKQFSALKKQKKGLMQQLLTGKKRVKLDEPELLAAAGA